MSIEKTLAKKQVMRLSQMFNFPREAEAINELVLALQAASSPQQAEAVISGFLDTAAADTRCPMPSGIRAACKALQEEPRPDPLCQICGGDGWRTITRSGLSGSERCRCWAPRPAPKIDYVPLAGQPGYVLPAKPMPGATDEDRAAAAATGIYGSDDAA